MSWLDPGWQYFPAATHGDSQAFAQRQRERAKAAEQATQWVDRPARSERWLKAMSCDQLNVLNQLCEASK